MIEHNIDDNTICNRYLSMDDFTKEETIYIENNIQKVFEYACNNGYYDIVRYLHEEVAGLAEHIPRIVINEDNHVLFEKACRADRRKLAEYLYLISTESENTVIDIRANDCELFRDLCYDYGHKNIVDMLYKLSIEDEQDGENARIDIHISDDEPFLNACSEGHIDIAEWLYNTSKIDDNIEIDIHMNDDEPFKSACEGDHINVAKWLYDLSKSEGNKIDIHMDDNHIFKQACRNGRIKVAKWLYEISHHDDNVPIDITENNDFVFRSACDSSRNDVVEWLFTLNSNYSFTVFDGNFIIPRFSNSPMSKLQAVFNLCDEQIEKKLDELCKNAEIVEISAKTCPICLSSFVDKKYQVQLQCGHHMCVKCFVLTYGKNEKANDVYTFDDYFYYNETTHLYDIKEINKLNTECHYKCDKEIDFNNLKFIKLNSKTSHDETSNDEISNDEISNEIYVNI